MPPKREFFKYSEEDVYKTIEEIKNGAKIRPACRKYNIPHSTILNKIKMKHPIGRKMGPPTILTSNEEELLRRWILAMAKMSFPVDRITLVETIKIIIKND